MKMTPLNIRAGLRKLEFTPVDGGTDSQNKTRVVVEFAQEAELAHDQVVRINLGIRSGIERALEGLPRRVRTTPKVNEYLYRLEGEVG
jgi:hypothetical protein